MFSFSNKARRTSAICYLVIAVVFATIKMLSHFGVFSFLGVAGKSILSALIQLGLLFCTSIFLFSGLLKTKPKHTFTFYGFKKISFKGILVAIILGIIVYILNVFGSSFFKVALENLGYHYGESAPIENYTVWLLLLNVLITAILPAICEETVHRGMLFKSNHGLGVNKSIIFSAVLFGLLHCNIEQFFYATIIGLYLGYITSKTENIYPAIIIHFINNFLSVLMGFSRANNLGIDCLFTYTSQFLSNNIALGSVFVFALISLLIIVARYLTKKLPKITLGKNLRMVEDKIMGEIAKSDYLHDLESIAKEGRQGPKIRIISPEVFNELYLKYSLQHKTLSLLDLQMMQSAKDDKRDKITLAINITTFVILGALTVFSFIWGVL